MKTVSAWCAGFFIVTFLAEILLCAYARKKIWRSAGLAPCILVLIPAVISFGSKKPFLGVAGIVLVLLAVCSLLGFLAGRALYKALERKHS